MIVNTRIHNIILEIITILLWFSAWSIIEIFLFNKEKNALLIVGLFVSVVIMLILKYFLEVDDCENENL